MNLLSTNSMQLDDTYSISVEPNQQPPQQQNQHQQTSNQESADFGGFQTGHVASAMIEGPADETEQYNNTIEMEEDAFVAVFGSDSSHLLFTEEEDVEKSTNIGNGNQQQHRYHINKLYQPLNKSDLGAFDCNSSAPPSPLVESDQEHLLYQGLKFFDCGPLVEHDERQSSSVDQLTRILVDDDGDDGDDDNSLVSHHNHLSAIFDSFSTNSPLIGGASKDHLQLDHHHHHHQQQQLMADPPPVVLDKQSQKQEVTSSLEIVPAVSIDVDSSQPTVVNKKRKRGRSNKVPSKRAAQMQLSDTNKLVSSSDPTQSKLDDESNRCEEVEQEEASSSNSYSGAKSVRPQLNVYRRRTANARERVRMREINQAFEKLKKVVPVEMIQQASLLGCGGDSESDQTSGCNRRSCTNTSNGAKHDDQCCQSSVKLTKISTLRLAKAYIATLTDLLNEQPLTATSSPSNTQSCSARFAVESPSSSAASASRNNTDQSRKRRCRRRSNKTKLPIENSSQPTLGQPNQPPSLVEPQAMAFQRPTQILPTYQPAAQMNQALPTQTRPQAQDGRAFVTPVALAFLGIPSQQVGPVDAPQPLQIMAQRPTSYGLIAQPTQQVTFTLDELSGLQVLRLANPAPNQTNLKTQMASSPIRSQQQQQHQLIKQVGPQLISATQAGPSYSLQPAYQIAQLQTQSGHLQHISLHQQIASMNGGPAFQARHQATTNNIRSSSETSLPITGTDCKGALSIAPTSAAMIATNGCQLVKLAPAGAQTGHFLTNQTTLMAISSSGRLFQTQPSGHSTAGLIYLNQSAATSEPLRPAPINHTAGSHVKFIGCPNEQQQQQVVAPLTAVEFSNSQQRQLEQADNEANIHKLVATLATSIHNPITIDNKNGSGQTNLHVTSKSVSGPAMGQDQTVSQIKYHIQARQPAQQVFGQQPQPALATFQLQTQSQPKKTYRFHNYDGNMISNHLYNSTNTSNVNSSSSNNNNNGSNHDKQQQQSQQKPTASNQQQQQPADVGQRSRQNSLSSTCSTTSSLSSSLASTSSSSSPIGVGQTPNRVN